MSANLKESMFELVVNYKLINVFKNPEWTFLYEELELLGPCVQFLDFTNKSISVTIQRNHMLSIRFLKNMVSIDPTVVRINEFKLKLNIDVYSPKLFLNNNESKILL